MMRPQFVSKLAMVLFCGLMAGCQTNPFSKDVVAAPPIVNGTWASSDGVYKAEFLNGGFRAIANDTGNVISQGSYIASSKDNIQLKWTSNLTGQNNQANCIKSDINTMNCTDAAGGKFTLRRGV